MSCCGQKRRAISEPQAGQPRPIAPSAPRRKSAPLEAAMLAFLVRRARSGPGQPASRIGRGRTG
jgi:hypothetical protein